MTAALVKLRESVAWHARVALYFGPAILILGVGLLLFHRIPEGYDRPHCADNWDLSEHINIVLNCDSIEYLGLAEEPQNLLLPTSNRQSRPGLVLLASLLDRLLPSAEDLSGFLGMLGGHALDPWTIDLFSTYPSYLVLNLASLWVAFVLFASLLGTRQPSPVSLIVGCLLVFNDVTKTFFFSPHTTLLAIVAPLFAVWCYRVSLHDSGTGRLRSILMGLVTGLAVTAYALFLVAVPLVLLGIWQNAWSEGKRRWTFGLLAESLAILALSVGPSLLWYFYVRANTGTFFFAEVRNYAEVVWLWSGLQSEPGATLLRLAQTLGELGLQAGAQAIPALVLILIACSARRGAASTAKPSFLTVEQWGPPVMVSALCLMFFGIAGLAEPRRAFAAVPPIVLLSGMLIGGVAGHALPIRRRIVAATTALLVIVQAVALLAKTGPFS